MIVQDLNKYGTPKFRLVVRFTNKDIIAQVIFAKVKGDVVLAAAYAHELPGYGIKVGLTNYSAAYATGLLLARRVLTKLNIADKYVGVTAADGKHFLVEEVDDGPRPFYVLLDVGLTRTSTGNRVFGAMKGAADGGLNVPHSERRLAGYLYNKEDAKDSKFDPEILRKYIFGGHVAAYMKSLEKDDAESFKRQFSQYLKNGITADKVEAMYKSAHAAIRAKPAFTKKEKKTVQNKRFSQKKLTLEQRRAALATKKAAQ